MLGYLEKVEMLDAKCKELLKEQKKQQADSFDEEKSFDNLITEFEHDAQLDGAMANGGTVRQALFASTYLYGSYFQLRNGDVCPVKLQVAFRLFTKHCSKQQVASFVSKSLNDMGRHGHGGHWRDTTLLSIAKSVQRKEIDLSELMATAIIQHNLSDDGMFDIIRIDPVAALGLQSSIANTNTPTPT